MVPTPSSVVLRRFAATLPLLSQIPLTVLVATGGRVQRRDLAGGFGRHQLRAIPRHGMCDLSSTVSTVHRVDSTARFDDVKKIRKKYAETT